MFQVTEGIVTCIIFILNKQDSANRKTTRANDDDEFIFYLSTIVDIFVVLVLNGLVPPPDDCHLSLVVGSYHPDHQIVPHSSW